MIKWRVTIKLLLMELLSGIVAFHIPFNATGSEQVQCTVVLKGARKCTCIG